MTATDEHPESSQAAGPLRAHDGHVLGRLMTQRDSTRLHDLASLIGLFGGVALWVALNAADFGDHATLTALAYLAFAGLRALIKRRIKAAATHRQQLLLASGQLDEAVAHAEKWAAISAKTVKLDTSDSDFARLAWADANGRDESDEPADTGPKIRWNKKASRFISAAYGVAYAELRRGNVDRAVAIWSEIYRGAQQMPDKEALRAATEVWLAIGYAALGECDAAAEWERGLDPDNRTAALATAVVLARHEQWSHVCALQWPGPAPAQRLPHSHRAFSLVQAFALAQLGADHARALPGLLDAARPAHAGEYDYLTGRWPDFQRFREQHELPAQPIVAGDSRRPARVWQPEQTKRPS